MNDTWIRRPAGCLLSLAVILPLPLEAGEPEARVDVALSFDIGADHVPPADFLRGLAAAWCHCMERQNVPPDNVTLGEGFALLTERHVPRNRRPRSRGRFTGVI